MLRRCLLLSALGLIALDAAAQNATPDAVAALVTRIEQAVLSGDRASFMTLAAPDQSDGAEVFWRQMSPAPDQLVIKERERRQLPDGSRQLVLEMLTVRSDEGRVSTWVARIRPAPNTEEAARWQLLDLVQRSAITGLYRLSLDTTRQFAVSRLRLVAPDLELAMNAGTAFLATVSDGATALVLLGRGTMTFTPPDDAERTQLRLFSGNIRLQEEFDSALLRVNPAQIAPIVASSTFTPTPVSASDVRRALRLFEETVGRTLALDLNDLSRDRWSLIPPPDDIVAEVRTNRFGTLTYARVQSQLEDVTFFDRTAAKSVSSYASPQKLAARGRFYSEDDAVEYDVESIDLEADIDPGRSWIEGRTSLTLVTRVPVMSLTLKLAEPLAVRSLESDEFGRLILLRIPGQDSVLVKLPATVGPNQRVTLRVAYGGRLLPQALEPSVSADPQPLSEQDGVAFTPEPRHIYSTRSYWYPQSPVLDHATARLRISVPSEYRVVASGRPTGTSEPDAAAVVGPGRQRARTSYHFEADRPVPYLACVVSRFELVSENSVDLGTGASLSLVVQANNRQVSKARAVTQQATSMLRFYTSLLGDAPYPSLALAVSESDIPGGHGPAYAALIDQTLPTSRLVWKNDPVNFPDYPSYMLAHELAHQWWGQAVNGKNYHERWISEGFAQYFAALYAEHERGADTFAGILRRMQRSAIEVSAQGPIALGHRLGHIRSDSRVLRAILYNKSAMVLHLLRRLIGDQAFFDGLRRFYGEFRFRKAGTDDFRQAMERASGRNLESFMEAWIFGSSIPRLKVSRSASPTELSLTFEQLGPVMPVPVTVTIVYTDGSNEDVIVPVTEARVSRVMPLRGTLRDVKIDDDHAALATFQR